MKKFLTVLVFSSVMLPGVALAQTYPPSDTPPPPTTVVCTDCDTAVTGTDAIGWGAAVAIGLLGLGTTAAIVARKRSRDV